MPSQETAFRRQKAVVFDITGRDRYNEPVVSPGREISVRWNNDQGEMLDSEGNRVRIDASVEVAEDIRVGSLMVQSELIDWYGSGSGNNDSDLMQVVVVNRTPDIKGRAVYRRLGLVRFRRELSGVD